MSLAPYGRRAAMAAFLAGALASGALAQTVDTLPPLAEPLPAAPLAASEPPPRSTWELVSTHSELTGGLADGASISLRGAIGLPNGDGLQLEVMEENKFGDHGGVAAGSYTRVLSEDWYLVQTLVIGHGGPAWSNVRVDTQFSRKWLAQRQLVSSVALYRAWLEDRRSDKGARLSLAWYLPFGAVLEGGIVLNVSDPGSVNSRMPYAAVTLGHEGRQYISLRVASGSEAYQAIGTQAQLVGFDSTSVALNWRKWLGPRWGLSAQAEYYRNPTYKRRTLGGGLFVQF